MPVKTPKPLMGSIKDGAYFDGMKELADKHLALCKNSLGCVRPANGTDGLGLCMHCEDDLMNYLQVKGGPWGGPNGGGVFRHYSQASLSGISEEEYNRWEREREARKNPEIVESGLTFVRKCGNGSCTRSGDTATRQSEAPSWCKPCQENSDSKLTL